MAKNYMIRDKKTGSEIFYIGDILKIGDGAKIVIGDKEEFVITKKNLEGLLKDIKATKKKYTASNTDKMPDSEQKE